MDIKPTFLRGELDEKNCMAQLEGFKILGGEDKARLLKNFLYGLQLPRRNTTCFLCLRSFFIELKIILFLFLSCGYYSFYHWWGCVILYFSMIFTNYITI